MDYGYNQIERFVSKNLERKMNRQTRFNLSRSLLEMKLTKQSILGILEDNPLQQDRQQRKDCIPQYDALFLTNPLLQGEGNREQQ